MKFVRLQPFLILLAALILGPICSFASCTQPPGDGGDSNSQKSQSHDPNAMEGPLGYGDPDTQRFVLTNDWLNYKIHFENMSNATASACEIQVTATLSGNLDWSTFEFSEVGLGSQTDTSFFGKKGGEFIVPLQGATYKLKMIFSLNETTGELSCYLRAWDETQADQNYLPADVLAGILPPDDDTGRGEGYIAYRVKVKSDLTRFSRIDSSATIVFDSNSPLTTDPAWWNLVTTGATVTFDAQGGSVSPGTATVVYGATYADLPVPVRTNYTFSGWWTGVNGTGNEITNGAPVVATTDQTLYAKWAATNIFHPADTDQNMTVETLELLEYIDGWQRNVSGFETLYLLNAVELWQSNKPYVYDGAEQPPGCWKAGQ